jgi:DNA polymerase III subunit delta'
MRFADVIGQRHVKQQLINMAEQNRISHAILFLGNEGSGALPLAIAFAQYIVCEKRNFKEPPGPSLFGNEPELARKVPEDSCGACPACVKAQGLIHPDIHYTYPVISGKKSSGKPLSSDYAVEWREFIKSHAYGNSYDWLQMIGAENQQGNISADECNEINRVLSLKSYESEYKIHIIWLPEYLAKEGNKLLKIIEEPPAKTIFILVAQDEQLILPTILSRTFLVKVPALEDSDIEAVLVSKGQLEDNKARQVAILSEGNYREALQTVQHASEDWQVLLRDWLNAILRTGPIAQMKWIDEVAKLGRERQKQFLRYFTHLLEKCIRLRVTGAEVATLAPEEHDFAERLNSLCSLEAQEAIINELDKASFYVERNAHARLLFHALTLRLYHIIKDKSLILVN